MTPTIFSSSVVRCLRDKLSRLQGLQLASSLPALRSFRVCGKANWRNCGSSSQVQRGLGIALRERSNIACSRRPVSGQGGDTRKIEKMTGGKEVSNKQVLFKEYVDEGWPTEANMEVVTVTKKLELKEGSKEVLVKVLYLSCDPYMRGRMRNIQSYIPAFKPGQPMSGYGVGKVVLSNDPKFVENDYVGGFFTWEEYCVGIMLQKIDVTSVPLTYWLGALGMPGFTAYAGLFDIGKPKKGETVYVSAAAGAVGQMVGQFAKLAGCYVVGSAGSQQKINLLKETFKYDDAFNYKEEPDLDAALKRCCPNGIDIYFENVGGKMLDAVLLNVNVFARIIACGMISQYNLVDHEGIFNLSNIVKKRVTIRGFLQSDHLQLMPEFEEKVLGWFKEKKLEYVEDISDGLEEGPKAVLAVLSGKNVGKQSIKVADDV